MVVKLACLSDPKSWFAGALAPAIFSHVRVVEIRKAEQSTASGPPGWVLVWDQSSQAHPIELVSVMKIRNILICSVRALL